MSMYKIVTSNKVKLNNNRAMAQNHIVIFILLASYLYSVPARVRIFKGGKCTSQVLSWQVV